MDKLLKYFNGDELAASVWKQKYAIEGEETPDDMHRRMAKEFARVQDYSIDNVKWNNLSYYGRHREHLTEERIYNLFKNFKYIVPQGSVMAILGSNKIGSLSNCFVVGQPYDSYGGIFQKDQELAQLMKRRGGVGGDISTLRPALTPVTNAAGTSSGAVLFMERFSNTTREVAQDGRRGALMLSIDVRHPDVKGFATIKQDLTKVTGANISVQLRDDFMQAVISDSDYILRWPCNTDIGYFEKTYLEDIQVDIQHSYYLDPYDKLVFHKNPDTGKVFYTKRIKARELWNTIIECAHATAEPGLMFLDKHWDYSPDTVYPEYKGITSNPSLRGDTLVKTDLGLIAIQDLANKQGMTIVKNIKNEWQVGKVFMSGKDKELYKITFTNGYEVYCTPEHKWPILNSQKKIFNGSTNAVIKKRTDELMFGHPKLGGDRIPVPFNPDYEGNVSCTLKEEDGFIAGYYLGDGHLSYTSDGKPQYGFIVSEKEINDCGTKVLDYINSKKNGSRLSNWNQDHDSKAYSTTCSDAYFVELMQSLTLIQDKSCGIPKNVWTAGVTYIKGFIDGLFSSDGNVWDNKDLVHSRITLTTSRQQIAKDVQKLLNVFGIISNIQYQKTKEGFERWNLVISGLQVRKFALIFTLTSAYKQEKLNNILNFKNTYKDNREYLVVKNVESTGLKEDVYDITVYDDTHTFQGEFGVTGNCGEIFMGKYDACRLLALNLYSFAKFPFESGAYFDFEEFYKVAYEQQYLADVLVDLEIERVDAIIKKIESDPEPPEVKQIELDLWLNIKHIAQSSRRTGSGFTALGDTLAALGLKYDSDEALSLVEKIMETKFRAELDCTIDLAVLKGPFKGWSNNNEYYGFEPQNSFYKFLKENYPEQQERMFKFGRRNVSWSTVAPTGSVSILTQTTSGLEPLFSWGYMRRKKVNPGDKTSRIDFVDQNGDSWMEYPVLHPKFKDWLLFNYEGTDDIAEEFSREKLENEFKNSPWYKSTANDIDWTKRVEIQSIIQRYTTHSISTTLNLPNDVSLEEVSKIYMDSWKLNLKGQTIYRDGCRSGVLVNLDSKPAPVFEQHDAPKRPKVLHGDGYIVKYKGSEFLVIIGLFDGKPYEVFAFNNEWNVDIEFACDIIKVKKGKYDLRIRDEVYIENFTNSMTENEEVLSRMISTSLRHGADIKFIVEQLQKTEGELNSFSKVISRTLKRYIPDGEQSTLKCTECGEGNLIFQEGCLMCQSCGNSKCG